MAVCEALLHLPTEDRLDAHEEQPRDLGRGEVLPAHEVLQEVLRGNVCHLLWPVVALQCMFPCQLLNTDSVVPDSLRGVFRSRAELDGYETMWHSCVYQPSWNELRPKVLLSTSCAYLMLSYFYIPIPHAFVFLYSRTSILLQFTQYSELWQHRIFIDLT